jgi:hypothetical protein
MRAELALLEASLGYRFANPELLRRALTHSSAAHEAQVGASLPDQDNERLEFLGDSILGFLTSEALVARYPECREGDLSSLRAHLVSAIHLYGVASALDLGRYLALGRSEEMSGGRGKKTLLVDRRDLSGWRHRAGARFDCLSRAGRSAFRRPHAGSRGAGVDHQFQERSAGVGAVPQIAAAAICDRGGARSRAF